MAKNPDDYEVGYKKPPKHSQFPPGVSGRTGRRKPAEAQAEIVARVRDEPVEFNGKLISKFELTLMRVMNETLRSGDPRDLKILLELLDKHGALPHADLRAQAEAGANQVIEKIKNSYLNRHNIDREDFEARRALEREEVQIILSSPDSITALKALWARPDYKEVTKRVGKTSLHGDVEERFARSRSA